MKSWEKARLLDKKLLTITYKCLVLSLVAGISIAVLTPKLALSQATFVEQNETLRAQSVTNTSEFEALSLNSLGLSYMAQKNYPRAIEYFRQSVTLAEAEQGFGGEGTLAITLNNLGAALFLSGQFKEAEQILWKAMTTTESLRDKLGANESDNIQFFDAQQSFIYRTLQQVLVEQKKFSTALEVAERGRTRVFVERLRRQLNGATSPSSSLPQDAFIKVTDIQRIAKTRNLTLVEYSLLPDSSEIFIPNRVKDELQNKPTKLYIWVVQPTGKILFHPVNLTSHQKPNIALSQIIASTRISLGVRGRGSIEVEPIAPAEMSEQLQNLYNILIEPIDQFLPQDSKARIAFVPQESLFLLPFAALKDTSGKYLIEKHTLLIVPSIQTLTLTYQQRQRLEARQRNTKTGDPLIVGNPVMPVVHIGKRLEQLPDLPGAQEEAEAVAKLLKVKALTKNQATKAAVLSMLPQARIIHLATHGLLDDFGGEIPGAIALAPSENDKGLLTSKEIQDFKLNASLVVLSACDTGRGRLNADGIIGLSRSLFVAGVPSAIVSLWSVPDAPTAELMTEFYRNWLFGKLDKAQALRQAMLKMIEDHRNFPRNWSAFTLIGEAD